MTKLFMASLVGVYVAIISSPVHAAECGSPYAAGPFEEVGNEDILHDAIGGGPDYDSIVSSGDFTAGNKAQLKTYLTQAVSGETIYINPLKQINLTGEKNLSIPAGVTLASKRGSNGGLGAILYVNDASNTPTNWDPLFLITEANVRITGIRFQGPHALSTQLVETSTAADLTDHAVAIEVDGAASFEFDNNETYGWNEVVRLSTTTGALITNNSMHHNNFKKSGYGVNVNSGSSATIKGNLFYFNRHDIAATGDPDDSYEASFNVSIHIGGAHSFDMHPDDPNNPNDDTAGDYVDIRNNLFAVAATTPSKPAIKIRGTSINTSFVEDNCFANTTLVNDAVVQLDADGEEVTTFTNITTSGNTVDVDIDESFVYGDFDGDGELDLLWATGDLWYMSYGITGGLFRITEAETAIGVGGSIPATEGVDDIGVGEFDGVLGDDIFVTLGTDKWQYFPNGIEEAESMADSTTLLSGNRLALGDFTGDGITDVLHDPTEGTGDLEISVGGIGTWESLSIFLDVRDETLSDLIVRDFDGDGRADLGRINTSDEIEYSSGARTEWKLLRDSIQRNRGL